MLYACARTPSSLNCSLTPESFCLRRGGPPRGGLPLLFVEFPMLKEGTRLASPSPQSLPAAAPARARSPQLSPTLIYAMLAAVAVFWGASFVAAKVALRELSPTNLVTLRFALAAFIFGPIAYSYHRRGLRITRGDWPMLWFLAWLGVTTYFLIQYQALRWTTATRSTIIITSNPLFTIVWSYLLLHERPGLNRLLAVGVALAGVLLVVWPQGGLRGGDRTVLWGDLLILSNALAWSLYSVLGRRLMRRYPPLLITAWVGLLGGLSLLPLALAQGVVAQTLQLKAEAWLMVLFLAVFCSGAGYLGWFAAIERVGPGRASVFLYLEPVVAAVLGVLFLGEALSFRAALGGALTVAGVYLTTRS